MKQFTVWISEVHAAKYTVEAKSKADAIRKVKNGEADESYQLPADSYVTEANQKEWPIQVFDEEGNEV